MKIGDGVYVVVRGKLVVGRVSQIVENEFFSVEVAGPGVTTVFQPFKNESHTWCMADDECMADGMRVVWGWK